MRRIKRLKDCEVSVQIKNDTFIRPPRDAQRNWLINRAVSEFAADLLALDRQAAGFVCGSDTVPIADRTQAELADDEIMESWQIPIMQAMAQVVARSQGAILEIGFGLGVSATLVQDQGVGSHTIIECNDSIVKRFEQWRAAYPGRDIRLVHGKWQDVLDGLGAYDGILFHTYPLNEDDYLEQVASSTTFAEHFFAHAAAHLVDGGIFTYLTNEIDSLSRAHQRALFEHFASIRMQVVRGLPIPDDVKDAWWADSMLIVEAVK